MKYICQSFPSLRKHAWMYTCGAGQDCDKKYYSSLEIKQELNCESALSECNDEHLQMCMYGQHEY